VTSFEFRDRLARRARRAKAPLTLSMLDPLEAYFTLLTQWNAKINLTALPVDAPTDETFDRLLVEPLAASRRVHDTPAVWFDLGSGGGSPAIPLKIARPALKLTMVEARERKSAFLREAVRVLGLAGTEVENARFEDVADDPVRTGVADQVTVRAVKADEGLFQAASKLLRSGGRLLLFRTSHAATPDPPGFRCVETLALIDAPATYLSIFKRVEDNPPQCGQTTSV
jgi:16S rRNA (guanine527-N7)-methyltransferase